MAIGKANWRWSIVVALSILATAEAHAGSGPVVRGTTGTLRGECSKAEPLRCTVTAIVDGKKRERMGGCCPTGYRLAISDETTGEVTCFADAKAQKQHCATFGGCETVYQCGPTK